ncbi:MAG: DUF58 domain-containing protein [Candidatus Ancillula sp.]|nr:DUF58 domain-containing protein [Candidatus Ancillula sp.]
MTQSDVEQYAPSLRDDYGQPTPNMLRDIRARGIKIRMTPLGMNSAILLIGTATLGFWLNWSAFKLVFFTLLVYMFIAATLTLLGVISSLDCRIECPKARLRVNDEQFLMLSVGNTRRGCGSNVELKLKMNAEEVVFNIRKRKEHKIRLPTSERQLLRISSAELHVKDLTGIFILQKRVAQSFEVFVHPKTVGIAQKMSGLLSSIDGVTTQKLKQTDLIFDSIREYTQGDLMKNVHWKQTAKLNRLVVKQFNVKTVSSVKIYIPLTGSSFSCPEEFETIISAAGSIGVWLMQNKTRVQVLTIFAGASAAEELSARTPRELLDRLTLLKMQEGDVTDMASFLTKNVPTQSVELKSSSIFFFGANIGLKDMLKLSSLHTISHTSFVRSSKTCEPGWKQIGKLKLFEMCRVEDILLMLQEVPR